MRAATVYRVLVALQTLALAIVSVQKVITHQPRAASGFAWIAIASIALVVIAVLVRRNIIATWTGLHIAGALALAGYIATGAWSCFGADLIALAVMHGFSPNRR